MHINYKGFLSPTLSDKEKRDTFFSCAFFAGEVFTTIVIMIIMFK